MRGIVVYRIILMMLFLLIGGMVSAQEISLDAGLSRTVRLPSSSWSVFVANDKIADYRIIDNNSSLVVYGKNPGKTDILVHDENGNILKSFVINVGDLLPNLNKSIKSVYQNANVNVSRLGAGYVVTGMAPSPGEASGIVNLIGNTLGLGKIVTSYKMDNTADGNSIQTEILKTVSYENLVDKINISTNQVNVKLTFIDVTQDVKQNLGAMLSGRPSGSVLTGGSFQIVDGELPKLINTISALDVENQSKILAEPNLTVKSGESASFLAGGEFPIETTNANGYSNVTFKPYGISMTVGVRVNNEKSIDISLATEVSKLDNITLGRTPALQTRKASSNVELANNQSFIISGLLSKEESESLSKIPFIGDIPVLGGLFRDTASSRMGRELLLIVSVSMVKPTYKTIPNDLMRSSHSSQLSKWLNISTDSAESQNKVTEFMLNGGFIF